VKGLAGTAGEARQAPLLARQSLKEVQVELPLMSPAMNVAEDYRTTRLSLKAHPCSFFRDELVRAGAIPAQALKTTRDRRWVSVGGLVLVRQRPGTAKGVVFLTLEDETGVANIVVWKDAFDVNRRLVMSASFLLVHGQVQSESGVVHLVAKSFTDLSHLHVAMKDDDPNPDPRRKATARLVSSRDFH
jgi:error-prone DNA polymerase